MASLVREAPLGQLIRYLTKNKYFQYPEEKPGFELPEAWIQVMQELDAPNSEKVTESNTEPSSESKEQEVQTEQPTSGQGSETISEKSTLDGDTEANAGAENLEQVKSIPITPKKTKDGAILVDWYYSDDAENPHAWSNSKRAGVVTIICLYTFVVYTTSAIYTSSETGIMEQFGVGEVVVTLGLSLYVLGYGVGPLLFSPLSEIPVIGRNPVYIITMFLFVIISIPTALVKNFPGLMVLRFLQGFFGSPCLASGGASIGDLYSFNSLPYAMMAWVAAAYCGRKF